MPGPTFIAGETVELRTLEDEDADVLQQIVNDPRVRRGLAVDRPVSAAAEREWIETVRDEEGVQLAICVEDVLVGTIGFDVREDVSRTGEVGYLLRPEAWDSGYATDALETIVRYAFEEFGLAKLVAQAYATNPASQRVLEKVGFVEEGVHRAEALVDGERVDVHYFGLLCAEHTGSA